MPGERNIGKDHRTQGRQLSAEPSAHESSPFWLQTTRRATARATARPLTIQLEACLAVVARIAARVHHLG